MSKKYQSLTDVYQSGPIKQDKKPAKKKFKPLREAYVQILEKDDPHTHSISIDRGEEIGITDNDFKEIKHLIFDRNEVTGLTKLISKQSNIDSKHALEIVKMIIKSDSPQTIIDYIKNRSVSMDGLIDSGNVYDVPEWSDVDPEFIKNLLAFKWAASPTIGGGEVFMSVMLKNAKRSTSKGDVEVGGTEIEVKADSGRLRGQRGYGEGAQATRVMYNGLKKLIDRHDVDVSLPREGSSDYNYNNFAGINKTAPTGWAAYRVAEAIIPASEGKVMISDINDIVIKAFKSVYTSTTEDDWRWVNNIMTSVDTYKNREAVSEFRRLIIVTLINYYMDLEQIDTIVTVNITGTGAPMRLSKGRTGWVGRVTRDNVYEYESNGVFISGWPSFGSGSGVQGMTAGITAVPGA